MSLIIDLIIIIAAVAAIYLGISRGFIRSVMHFAALILSIVAVYFFTAPLSEWISESFIEEKISGDIEASISDVVTAGDENLHLDNLLSDRPEALTNIAERFSFNIDEIEKYYTDFLSELTDGIAIEKIAEKIAKPTSEAISNIIAAVLIFIVSMLVLSLVTFILDLICRLPVLKGLNRFLGFLFGVASAIVTTWVISNIAVGLLFALQSVNGSIFNESVIESSIVLKFLYNNNLVLF